MEFIASIATNAYTYVLLLGVFLAMYCAWTLARKQYLNVNKLFNLVCMSLIAGWLAALVWQTYSLHGLSVDVKNVSFWVHPRPLLVLVGYIGIALVTGRYIRAIHYPYWRTLDIVAAALAVFVSIVVIGWGILTPTIFSAAVVATLILGAIAVVASSIKFSRHGIAVGVHMFTVFIAVTLTRFTSPSWQESTTTVEWTAVGIGTFIGLVIIGLRASSRSQQVIMQEIPRGVSRSFHDTFSKAFKPKQLPEDG